MYNDSAAVVIKQSQWSIRDCHSACPVFEPRHTVIIRHKVWQVTHVERVVRIWI